jgi:hypothetical protein
MYVDIMYPYSLLADLDLRTLSVRRSGEGPMERARVGVEQAAADATGRMPAAQQDYRISGEGERKKSKNRKTKLLRKHQQGGDKGIIRQRRSLGQKPF